MPGCCKTIISICCCCLFWRQRGNTNNNIGTPEGPRPCVGNQVLPCKPDENATRSSLASPPNPPQRWKPDENATRSSSASPPHPPRKI